MIFSATRPGSASTAAEHGWLIGFLRAIKPGFVGLTSVALVVVFFPLLVLGSAAVLLFLFWPLFLGAYLEYGYVPGTNVRGRETVSGLWYLGTFVWLTALTVGLPLFRRYRSSLRIPDMRTKPPRDPRPRA